MLVSERERRVLQALGRTKGNSLIAKLRYATSFMPSLLPREYAIRALSSGKRHQKVAKSRQAVQMSVKSLGGLIPTYLPRTI